MNENEETLYMHLRVGEGFATAAIRCFYEESNKQTYAAVGLAFCSPRDQFSRGVGRLIAEGRLNKGKVIGNLIVDPEHSVKNQVQEILTKVFEMKKTPRWAYKAHVERLPCKGSTAPEATNARAS